MESESLEQRLSRLERQCRKWRWAGIAFATLVGTPILATVVALLIDDGTREAEHIIIRDKEGRARIVMGTWKDGSPRLLFAGASGTPRMELRVGSEETPAIELFDETGDVRLSLDVGTLGPSVSVRDKDSKSVARIMLGKDGSPGMSFDDENGRQRLLAGLGANGTAILSFAGLNEKGRIMLGVDKDELPFLTMMDLNGKARFEIHLDKEGNPSATRSRP